MDTTLQAKLKTQISNILERNSPLEYDKLISMIDTSHFPRVIEMHTLLHGVITQKTENDKLIQIAIKSLENEGKINVKNVNPPTFSSVKLMVALN